MIKYACYFSSLTVASSVAAQSNPDAAAAAFGARESIESIRLSPDGKQVAYVAPAQGQGSGLYVVDLASGQTQRTTMVDGRQQRLGSCNWVSNERLVCRVFAVTDAPGEVVTVSRLVALDRDGSDIRQLGQSDSPYARHVTLWGGGVVDWLPGEEDSILLGQDFVPERRTRTNIERRDDGYGVVRLDTRSGSTRRVEAPRPQAIEYISDGRGNVRIMGVRSQRGETGQMGEVIRYFYRPSGSGDWQPFGEYNMMTREGFNPLAVDAGLNAAYSFEERNGRLSLFRVALNGSGQRELLVENEQVDVDSLLRIGRSGRVIGASYATETRQAVYFDPELRTLAEQLSQAMPGLPLVRFVDASQDESKLLIWAGSDTDPGRYYVYDKSSRRLAEIMLSRPQLEGVRLANVRPVTYRAQDGTMVPAYLTLPPGGTGRGLPAIVMPHGGPSSRDEWGFDWLAQYFAHRGYAVLQPNFRGSAGYGDEWFQRNGFQSWRTAIGDVNDAGRWLVSEGIADPARLAAFGWSYGGYAALQSAVVDPQLFRAVVAVAPVVFEGLDHYLQDSQVRADMLRRSDAFLRGALGIQ